MYPTENELNINTRTPFDINTSFSFKKFDSFVWRLWIAFSAYGVTHSPYGCYIIGLTFHPASQRGAGL